MLIAFIVRATQHDINKMSDLFAVKQFHWTPASCFSPWAWSMEAQALQEIAMNVCRAIFEPSRP
jgi:hypothetical protein